MTHFSKKLLTLSLFTLFVIVGKTQLITTVAGGASWPYNGQNALSIPLSTTISIADANGNIYYVDNNYYAVRKVTAAGVVSKFAGNDTSGYSGDGGPAIAAKFNYISGLSIDPSGNIYIVDQGNNRIRKVNISTGIITTVAGGGGWNYEGSTATNAELLSSSSAIDSYGNVYVTDNYFHAIRKISTSGIITTVAGNGTPGFSGDGGLATSASLNSPDNIKIDASNNIYFYDAGNNRIRKINTSGIITTLAGNGGQIKSNAEKVQAQSTSIIVSDFAVDVNSNIYFIDNNRIKKIDGNGYISAFAGTGVLGFSGDGGAASAAQFNYPSSIATDLSGNVYIADRGNNRIRKINISTGIINTIAGTGVSGFSADGGQATSAQIGNSIFVSVDRLGNVYITDNLSRIRKISTTGIITTIIGSSISGFSGDGAAATNASINYPASINVDINGNIYFSDLNNYRIRKITAATGFVSTIAGSGTAQKGKENILAVNTTIVPTGIAFDANSNLYIAEASNYRVRKVTASSGLINTIAGTGSNGFSGDGGQATAAKLNYPSSLAIDAAGNIFIADIYNYRIRKINTSGAISTVAGNGSYGATGDGGLATNASIQLTDNGNAIAVNAAGTNIYLATGNGNKIRKVTGTTISSIAGTGSATFSGDGFAATNSTLNIVTSISLDANENVYVTDQQNNRIRKITASSGNISTIVGNGNLNNSHSGDGGLATNAEIPAIYGIAFDKSNNMYISTFDKIRKVTASTGIISTFAGTGIQGYSGDGGLATNANIKTYNLAVDANGDVYFATQTDHRIRKVTASTGIITTIAGNGTAGFTGDGGQATTAQINGPRAISFDKAGNLYFVEYTGQRIRKINTAGVISTIAGTGVAGSTGDGGQAAIAQLNYPHGIAIDSLNNIYFSELSNSPKIRKIAPNGIITTVAGNNNSGYDGDGGLATLASLSSGWALGVDSTGNVLIPENNINVLRRVSTNGIITTIAGNGNYGHTGDGGLAKDASISGPMAAAYDKYGNIYVGDGGTVRKIFGFPAPTINYISSKIATPGTKVTIRGENFSNVSSAKLNTTSCTFEIKSDNLMTITIPSGASSGDIAVTSAYGTGKISGIIYSPSESNSAPVDIFLTSNAIEENNEIGKEIGTFVAQDGEDDVLKYELINGANSEDNASFRIDTATNKLIAKVSFNYEAKPILNIRVKGVDANANIIEKSFQIKVADVSEGIPVSTFVSISGNFSPSRLFIKNDSTLWGVFPNNAFGQLGDSTFVAKKGIFQIGKFKYLKAVTNGSSVFAIKSDSTLWSWGLNNTNKILGDATTTSRNIPAQISADKYIDINIGGQNVLAIKADGSLWGWGDNTNGQLGDTSSAVKTVPTKISNQTFTKAACYNNSTFLIATDGTLWAAGLNDVGQLGDGSKVDKKAFTKISNDKFKTVYISQSGEIYAIATDSSLWAWGTNNSGELGLGLSSTDTVFTPRKVPNIKILDLGASGNNLVVIKSDSTLWGCGNNDYYKLGDTITTFSNTLRLLDSKKYIKLYAHGAGSTTAVDKYGNAFVMGLVAYSSDSSYYPSNYSTPTLFNNAKNQQITSNLSNAGFLWQKSDQSWWSDIYGSYLDSLVKTTTLNVVQLKDYNFIKIIGESGTYAAINKNGELYTWGNNYSGPIGDGTTTKRLVPYKVSNDKFIDFSTSNGSISAIKEDGSLWGWGYNNLGKLGDGTTTNRLTPTLIDAGPFVSVNCSINSGYALKPDGSLYSWGYNAYGQLGNGTNTIQYVPKIAGTTKFNKVLSASYNVIGLGKDSLVYTWGYNNQLANGTYSATATPINLSSSIKFTDIGIAGSSITNMAYYAIAADGSLYSWGYNGNGQLGSGSFTSNFTPTKVSSDVYKAISSYNNSSVYFIKADGKTYATGVNNWNYLDHESIKVPYINMFPNVIPYTPNTTDTSYCSAATASAIVASNSIDGESTILKYYTLATGGTSSSTAFVPSTVKADTINYYVSQINKRGYESARKKLTVIIKATPVAPTVTDTAYCNNSVIDSLNATAIAGNTLYWYGTNVTGGTKSISRTIADTRTVGSSAYFVSQFNPNGCESPRAKITVKINALPANPIATNNFFCQGDTGKIASVSVLSGNKIYWYGTNATGGSGSLTATKVVATTAGNYNYYATQKNDTTGCESGRTTIPIFITAPLSTPIISRDASSNLVSSATYGNSWYKDGVKISDTTNTFKPTAIGKYTVKSSFLGCTSSMSGEYYYLITDVININASEFIKLVPNPFSSQINIDYSIKGYQKLSVEIFDIATGNRAGLIENVSAGSSLFLGNLSSGTYLIKVSSPDHKQSYQFKMIKL